MSQAPFPNSYRLRKVAETSAKSCDICYKLSTSVLITPDQKDFFYVCPSHLKDRQFCTALADDSATTAAKRDRQLAEEKERLKKEYEEKQKRKKEKEEKEKEEKEKKEKDKSGYVAGGFKAVGSGLKWGAKAIWGEGEQQPKEGQEGSGESADTVTAAAGGGSPSGASPAAKTAPSEDDPKTFELKPNFYNQRVQKKRQAEFAKRDRERATQPGYFPEVPTHQPGK